MKEIRFEVPLETYEGELEISDGGKTNKEKITDKRLLTLCLEMQRAESITELRKLNDLCSLIEDCPQNGNLLITEDQKKFLLKKFESMSWNPKKEIRIPVLGLAAKLEMAKQVDVEINKA